MSETALTVAQLRAIKTRVGQHTGYGPYLMLEALPWLLLATVMRGQGRMMASGLSLLVLLIAEFALFLAFLIASQKMIEAAGGMTSLGRLPMATQLRLTWSAIWRLLLLFLGTNLLALSLGMDESLAAAAWFGFDGIVFSWPLRWHPVWNGVIATLVFLLVLERGMDRKPSALAVARQLVTRFRYLGAAIVGVTLFLVVMELVQASAGSVVQMLYAQMHPGPLRNIVYIGFMFAFGYLRLLGTITILTLAARASWRAKPG